MDASVMSKAKAIVALVGVIVTALLGTIGPDDALFDWLTGIAAICTAIGVYVVPNRGATTAPAVVAPTVPE